MKYLLLALFISTGAQASEFESALVDSELRYVQSERQAAECLISQNRQTLLASIPAGKGRNQIGVYNLIREQLESTTCNQAIPLNPPRRQVVAAGPLYSEVPYDISVLGCALKTGDAFFICEGAREKFLSPMFLRAKANCQSVGSDRTQLNDSTFWHHYLLTQGYECTVSEFRRLALLDPKSQSFQARLESNNRQIIQKNQITQGISLSGLNIAYVPYLTYDGEDLIFRWPYNKLVPPRAAELLNVQQFKRGLEGLGAKVTVIHRTTTSSFDDQIRSTLTALKALDQKTQNRGGYVVLTRSFGAALLTYILNNHRAELPNLKGVLNIAGTPKGSAIAEYKTRWDYFFNGTTARSLPTVPLIKWIDMADDIDFRINDNIDDLLRHSFNRSNQLALSFKNPRLRGNESAVDVPVINYTFLNPTEASRVKSSDPVYSIMTMYGPVEGSARLADTAFESQNHVRVFYDGLGHLSFRQFGYEEAINVYLSLLKTAKDEGMISY